MKLTKEKQLNCNKPKKIGYLKENIWFYNPSKSIDLKKISQEFLISEKEKDNYIRSIINNFQILIPSKTPFFSYIEENGDELWCNYDMGLESLNSDWAKINLINIGKIK